MPEVLKFKKQTENYTIAIYLGKGYEIILRKFW